MPGIRRIYYGPRDNPKYIEQEYFLAEECKPGYLYKIRARNAGYGIWTPRHSGFHISREKFGRNYLFVEIHYDLSSDFGTAIPLKEIEIAPFKIEWLQDWKTKRSIECHVLEYLNRRTKELEEPE
jgi:hypothetical protein